MTTKRPNVLFITTDQQRADHLGCYGNAAVKTPHIDSLAERGTRFDRFYVACPICMPNRVAILTGRMPTTNGTRHNGIPLPLDAVTFVDLLRAGGYHTALIGKGHFQNITGHKLNEPNLFPETNDLVAPPDELNDASRRRLSGPDYEHELMPSWHKNPDRKNPPLPYYGYDFVRFANGHSDHVQGHYNAWLAERHDDPDRLRGPENAMPAPGLTAPQAWRTSMPEELYPTTYIEEETRSFIDQHLEERPKDPFFIHCSFTDPHHPFTPPGHYFDMYDADEMALPASFGHIDENEPSMLKRLRQEHAQGQTSADGPLPFCVDEKEAKQILALTYGMISMVDDAVGRLLGHLKDRGIADDTLVIFSSDHGDFMGDHGLMLKHGLHYEGVLRVPFIWADPDDNGPATSDRCASSVDISTTILARVGLAPNNGNQGVDLFAPTTDGPMARKGILIEEDELGAHLGTKDGLRSRTYIHKKWRITMWQGMEGGQLYDRGTDPHEMHNLWFETDQEPKKSELMEEMIREMIRLGDNSPYATHVA